MKKIILDTNFIIYCIKNKIRIEEEINRILNEKYQIFVLEGSIKELKNLDTKESKIAIVICRRFKIIPSKYHVDLEIKRQENKDTIIATNDKKLKKSLKKPIITVRSKSHLELIS